MGALLLAGCVPEEGAGEPFARDKPEAVLVLSTPLPTWTAPTLRADANFPAGVLEFPTTAAFEGYYRSLIGAEIDTSSSVSGASPPYSLSNTNSAQQGTWSMNIKLAAGQTIELGTCDLEGSAFTGDTYLRLFQGATQVAANDDACGGVGSRISYSTTTATTLQVRGGCYSSGSCTATVAYSISDNLGTPTTRDGARSYTASNTSNAWQNSATFSLALKQGQSIDVGTCGVAGSAFSGDTYIRLSHDVAGLVAASDDACGGYGSRVTYTAAATGIYLVQLGCYSSGACSGTAAYTTTAPLTQQAMLPAMAPQSLAAWLAANPPNDPPGDAVIAATTAEYLRDLKAYLVPNETTRLLLDPSLQVVVAGQLYHVTNIGLFRVDLAQVAAYKTWYAANEWAINTDLNYTSVPGETDLGGGVYQVMPGVTRSTIDVGQPTYKFPTELGGDPPAEQPQFVGDLPSDEVAPQPNPYARIAPDHVEPPDFSTPPQAFEIGRIAYWSGKVNVHKQAGGSWTHDTDCSSGAGIDALTYCRKFWPNTASVTSTTVTSKSGNIWYTGGCGASYPGDGLQEWVCNVTGGSGTTPPAAPSCSTPSPQVTYLTQAISPNFSDARLGQAIGENRKFTLQVRNAKFFFLYNNLYIEGKMQRRKTFLGIPYWGESNADEIVVGTDNFYIWTDYIFPTPLQFSQLQRPKFKGLYDYQLGNWVVKAVGMDVNIQFPGYLVTQNQITAWLNDQLNSVVGSVWQDVWRFIERNILDSIDASYSSRYAAYTKHVNRLRDANRLTVTMGFAEKAQCYGHQNQWDISNGPRWATASKETYTMEVRSGSFFGRARLGNTWVGVRLAIIPGAGNPNL